MYYTKLYTQAQKHLPENLSKSQQSIIFHLIYQSQAIWFDFHPERPPSPNLIPYHIKALGAVPNAIYLIMDRGQKSGAALKYAILASSYHQNSSDQIKKTTVLWNKKCMHPPIHLLLNKEKKKSQLGKRRSVLDIHKNKSKMKNVSHCMHMSWPDNVTNSPITSHIDYTSWDRPLLFGFWKHNIYFVIFEEKD